MAMGSSVLIRHLWTGELEGFKEGLDLMDYHVYYHLEFDEDSILI